MFAPPGGRFPPNLPPLLFSTAFLLAKFVASGHWSIGFMQMPAVFQALFSPGVTEVMFVGARHCYADRAGVICQVSFPFSEDSELSQFLIELALESGSRLDIAKPMADFGIENFRLSAQLKSAVTDAPAVTIRKHPKKPQSPSIICLRPTSLPPTRMSS